MPLMQLTDGPLYETEPGTLSELTNMMLRNGYAEARGGMDKVMPSGGTNADPISAGCYSSVHQVATSYGWIRTFSAAAGAGSQYSANLQFHPGGWPVFPTYTVGDCVYFGADADFGRVGLSLITLDGGLGTQVYEYWNGPVQQAPNGANANWASLTTSETMSFNLTDLRFASWTAPTDWALCTVGDSGTGNVLKKWMRIRLTATGGATVSALAQYGVGYWGGMRELYSSTQSPRTSGTSGALRRNDQTGTTKQSFSVGSSLYSASDSKTRVSGYRGRVFMVNGKEQKRWDGNQFVDIGLTASAATGTVTAAALASGKGAGVWRYYFAWGYGPCQSAVSASPLSSQQDAQPLYGYGQAKYIGEATTTAGANELVNVKLTSAAPADASCVAIYVTQDLTNAPVGDKPNFPAFLTTSCKRIANGTWDFESGFGPTAGVAFQDSFPRPLFPPKEALTYDVSPPSRCKFVAVYQNRLFLADNDTIYWSDPFTPDIFSLKSTTGYIRLARSTGGRHMGIVEFADQLVAFTEDQTWGITNVDLDVPQLYPIHPGIGCIAPESIAVGDGWLIWMGKDGFYAWNGAHSGPVKVSNELDRTFRKLSYENHGGSRATIHNRQYDVRLSDPAYSSPGLAYKLNLENMTWSAITLAGFASTLFPLATIHAPLGNNDAGVLHSVWGKADYGTGAGEYGLFLGDLTTQDNGNNYTCSATMHFPVGRWGRRGFIYEPGTLFAPDRVLAYYSAPNGGWNTASASLLIASANVIGSALGNLTTTVGTTGDDYTLLGGKFSEIGSGTTDIRLQFSVPSAAGGTVNGQRFHGASLQGTFVEEIGRYLV